MREGSSDLRGRFGPAFWTTVLFLLSTSWISWQVLETRYSTELDFEYAVVHVLSGDGQGIWLALVSGLAVFCGMAGYFVWTSRRARAGLAAAIAVSVAVWFMVIVSTYLSTTN